VRRLGAVAGVQVTASHNPPGDNGYKVYLDSGTQLVPPTDRAIETAIAAAPSAVSVPTAPGWTRAGPALVDAYTERVAALARGNARELRVAVTPLHGVGGAVLLEALRRAGFNDVHLVASQSEPDPDFPTVGFPNPEEPGAADALLALASEANADLAVALDPDADRCALGVPDAGRWRMLRGDETGVLLGEHVLAGLDREANPDPLVATSIVSSTLLRSVAAAHGARHDETRTGFKWLVRAGDGAGTGLVYAYEEALGYCVDPDVVRDKDGISAAVLACDLAATARSAGRRVTDLLDDLARAHGVYLTDSVGVWMDDHDAVATAMARLRGRLPTELAGVPVTAEDLVHHPDQPDDTIALRGDGFRVMVRPSGTEPKLKAYLEVVEPLQDGHLDAARQLAVQRRGRLRDAIEALLRSPFCRTSSVPSAV
ncbi:MAG: phospho-sugar mutase, partial [Pseudonocardiaceae bacterium]